MPQIRQLVIRGGASGKILKTLPIDENEFPQVLMYYLQANGLPIASSCNGEGICLKCQVRYQEQILISCQVKLADLFHNSIDPELLISYL